MDNFVDGVEIGGDFAREAEDKAPKVVEQVPNAEPVESEEAPEEEVLELDATDEAPEEEAPEEKPAKKNPSAQERIKQLVAEKRELERTLERERIKKEIRQELGLSGDEKPAKVEATRVAPDPSDLQKYPLGALDDRYVEDKIQYGIDLALGSVLQRQQAMDAQAEVQRVATENLKKVETVVQKGRELYDDYHEVVWEGAQRGDYDIAEPTFHAITEAEYGADVAYHLASNKAEAARVASLSPYQQVKYVSDKNAEFAAKRKPRLPKAGNPPAHQARGSNGKFSVDPATENLADFKRALFNR